LESTPDNAGDIEAWLSDGRGIAQSIWDEKMTTDKGNNVYRLQVMTVQFVTLQLAPWVDVEMKSSIDDAGQPVFTVQSINFDPNIQVLPGVKLSADAFQIKIDVAGELRRSRDGQGVTGKIAFATRGILSRPLRLVPEPVLKATTETINRTIVNFAIRSFEGGATRQYGAYQRRNGRQFGV
jgi:Protein of unknown function (DUF1997)